MANKPQWKVWIDKKAFSENVLKSAEVKAALNEVATNALKVAGEGYKAKPYTGRYRAGVIVAPDTPEAYYDNLHHNTLLKSIRGK